MIISGYPLIGKTTLVKNSTKKVHGVNQYVELESSSYSAGVDWQKKYVSIACLLSDIGFDVLISSEPEVIEELKNRKCGAIVVMPSQRLKTEWVTRALLRFKEDPSERNWDTLEDIVNNFDTQIEHLFELTKDDPNLHGVAMWYANTSLESLIDAMRQQPEISNANSKYIFLWGQTEELGEVPSLSSKNEVQLTREKESGTYYLSLSEKYMKENTLEQLMFLYSQLKVWYDHSHYKDLESDEIVIVGDEPLLDSYGVISGHTIEHVLFKLRSFIYSAMDN